MFLYIIHRYENNLISIGRWLDKDAIYTQKKEILTFGTTCLIIEDIK